MLSNWDSVKEKRSTFAKIETYIESELKRASTSTASIERIWAKICAYKSGDVHNIRI